MNVISIKSITPTILLFSTHYCIELRPGIVNRFKNIWKWSDVLVQNRQYLLAVDGWIPSAIETMGTSLLILLEH